MNHHLRLNKQDEAVYSGLELGSEQTIHLATKPNTDFANQVLQARLRIKQIISHFFVAEFEKSLRDLASKISVKLTDFSVQSDVSTPLEPGELQTQDVLPDNLRIHIQFDAESPLPRRHKVQLLHSAIQANRLVIQTFAMSDSSVEFILDGVLIPSGVLSF